MFPLPLGNTKQGRIVIATNQYKLADWGIISGSKQEKNAEYGLKIWDGQGVVKSGEIVRVMKWNGQETLISVGVKVKTVAKTLKTNGYTLYKTANK